MLFKGGVCTKIGFVSSPIYPELVRKLVEAEFDYIEVGYLTYHDYTETAAMVAARQKEFDAILFSGYVAYSYCCEHCVQEIPWTLVKSSSLSSPLASALRMALQKGYSISAISVDHYTKKNIESAYREIGLNPSAASIFTLPSALGNGLPPQRNEEVYQFHRRNLLENNATCCLVSYYYAYQRLREETAPLVFVEMTFDTLRRAFYQLYQELTEKPNEEAQIAALLVEIDLPGEYLDIAKDEFQYVKSRLRMSEKIYAFAERLQAIVMETSFNQFLVISTRTAFDRETMDFREFDLFEQVNSDMLNTTYFGIGLGKTAVDAKKHAFGALERAKSRGRNTACLVAANAETISVVSYIGRRSAGAAPTDDKIARLARQAGVSTRWMLQMCHAVDSSKKTTFTSSELAVMLGVSKRNMDRIILKLESASLARVLGCKLDGGPGRPSRMVQLRLGQ